MLGLKCYVRIYGSGFSDVNRILIVDPGSGCGDPNPTIPTFLGLANPQQAQVNADRTEATFNMGQANSGSAAQYKLCWGFDPLVLTQYNIQVGPFGFEVLPGNCNADTEGVKFTCSG